MQIGTELIISCIGGMLYVGMECLWRGHSHPSMFLLGSICFFLLGVMGRHPFTRTLGLFWQSLLGAGIITLLELLTGLIVNRGMRLDVWDYSNLPFNLMGQICLPYFLLWIPVAALAIFVNHGLRLLLLHQPWPHCHLF